MARRARSYCTRAIIMPSPREILGFRATAEAVWFGARLHWLRQSRRSIWRSSPAVGVRRECSAVRTVGPSVRRCRHGVDGGQNPRGGATRPRCRSLQTVWWANSACESEIIRSQFGGSPMSETDRPRPHRASTRRTSLEITPPRGWAAWFIGAAAVRIIGDNLICSACSISKNSPRRDNAANWRRLGRQVAGYVRREPVAHDTPGLAGSLLADAIRCAGVRDPPKLLSGVSVSDQSLTVLGSGAAGRPGRFPAGGQLAPGSWALTLATRGTGPTVQGFHRPCLF
jgi:hypothetical protein